MLNNVNVMGRLVRDPDLRYTGNETAVVGFTLAVDRDFGDKQADFIDCVAWRHTAEFISKYFSRGSMMVVSGRLQTRNWEDTQGNKRKSTEIVADSVYFGDSKKKEGAAPAVITPVEDDDGELPF